MLFPFFPSPFQIDPYVFAKNRLPQLFIVWEKIRPPFIIRSRATALYAVIEDHLEGFIRVYDEKYQKEFGFWRPVIQEVMEKYLECGDLHQGFARVRCGDCRHEFLLAFSCKGRYFCPSCHQKRVVSFAEWAEQEVLEKVPHRQYVFTIPKMLRIYFKYDRKLLGNRAEGPNQLLRN